MRSEASPVEALSSSALELNLARLSGTTASEIAIGRYISGAGQPFTVSMINSSNSVSPVAVSYSNNNSPKLL